MKLISKGIPAKISLSLFLAISLVAWANAELKVFVLAGQSNMQGQGRTYGASVKGSIDWLLAQSTYKNEFKPLVDAQNKPLSYNDVWVYYRWERYDNFNLNTEYKGNLSPEFGDETPTTKRVGPEYGIGLQLRQHYQDQVLLIKTAWGGHSLGVNFRPPSSGGTTGPSYLRMLKIVKDVTDNLKTYFPGYDGKGFKIAGFAWHQGWNDQYCTGCRAEYAKNLENLIDDLRKAWNSPNLPVSIGESGMLCPDQICTAQKAVANLAKYKGTVAFAPTTEYLRKDMGPTPDANYHWYESFWSYYKVGTAMGKAMVGLLGTTQVSADKAAGKASHNLYQLEGSLLTVTAPLAHHLELIDIRGNVVKRFSGAGRARYQMSQGLPPAIYMVKMTLGNHKKVLKLAVL